MVAGRFVAPLVKKSVRPDRVLTTLSKLKGSQLVKNIQKHRGTNFEAAAFKAILFLAVLLDIYKFSLYVVWRNMTVKSDKELTSGIRCSGAAISGSTIC